MSANARKTPNANAVPACGALARLWGLRMLVELGAVRSVLRFIDADSDLLSELLDVFELPELLEICERMDAFEENQCASKEERSVVYLRREVPRAFRRCLKNLTEPTSDEQGVFEHNLNLLARTLGLNSTERLLMHFGLLLTQLGWFCKLGKALGNTSKHAHINKLSRILRVPADEIRAALAPDGTLLRSGLLRLNGQSDAIMDLTDQLQLLEGLMEALLAEHSNTLGIFKSYFRRAGEAKLVAEDFAAHTDDFAMIQDYLCTLHTGAELGINFLIYGEPGVGKTQFARVLAQSLGRPLYEVTTLDGDGEMLDGKQRLRAYALSQKVLGNCSDALVLFDEAEDIFGDDMSFFHLTSAKPGRQAKAAINRLLEENPVPTLWLTNSIAGMDSAYLRRFQYVVELRGGTRATRRRNFAKQLSDVPVSPACIGALAEQEALTPAVVANAASVLRRLKVKDQARADATLRRVVEHTLDAMRLPHKPIIIEPTPTRYAIEYSNPDTDLTALVSGLRRCPRARICLYGPPGTGKTAYGRYLAGQLDKPLLVKRASDLLSMWVGMSEQNIAKMFRDAEREGAVLLLDEADSFLRERSGAHASWEITQVNEVLTQMEAFEGLFIASTNLMGTLDAASLRRFDFKIKFGYMNAAQAMGMFSNVLGVREPDVLSAEITNRLLRLDNLTPGDFVVIWRKARVFDAVLDAERLLRGLEDECRIKDRECSRPIGFTVALN